MRQARVYVTCVRPGVTVQWYVRKKVQCAIAQAPECSGIGRHALCLRQRIASGKKDLSYGKRGLQIRMLACTVLAVAYCTAYFGSIICICHINTCGRCVSLQHTATHCSAYVGACALEGRRREHTGGEATGREKKREAGTGRRWCRGQHLHTWRAHTHTLTLKFRKLTHMHTHTHSRNSHTLTRSRSHTHKRPCTRTHVRIAQARRQRERGAARKTNAK